jgi:hypothetical protein
VSVTTLKLASIDYSKMSGRKGEERQTSLRNKAEIRHAVAPITPVVKVGRA